MKKIITAVSIATTTLVGLNRKVPMTELAGALEDAARRARETGFRVGEHFDENWNLLKDYLEYEGISDIIGSRGSVREAFKRGLVEDGALWMDMISKRNLSSHTYNQALADSLVDAIIHDYHAAFMTLAADMRAKAGDDHVRPA